MPTTTYMVVDPRHDHSLRIPRPDLSAKLGMPNACNGCHAKHRRSGRPMRSSKWTGKTPLGFQNFAEALAAGSAGAPGARGALLALLDDKAQPAIVRASAIDRLGHWLTPATLDFAVRALNDPDPLVRLAAVEAIANAEPPVRAALSVAHAGRSGARLRIEAARALAGPAETGIAAADRPLSPGARRIHRRSVYTADRPEGRLNLGNLYATRGDFDRAIAEYRKALVLEPTFVAAYVEPRRCLAGARR